MLNLILNCIFTFIATLSFGVLCNIRGKNLIFAAVGGGLTWFIYLFFSSQLHFSTMFAFFVASIFAAIFSEIMARVLKTPVTSFVICTIIPLVPGSGMYNTMFESVQGNVNQSLILGVQTLSIAGCIAIGVFFVSSMAKMLALYRIRIKKRRKL